ncbi:MAG: hypothetical protein LBU91_08825, partial [Bacteroidales bacterium]|nr:hypothetical protein [Bacteroidales bacterium]
SDIYRIKNGVKVSNSIKRILDKDHSINIDWLETGEGEMLKFKPDKLATVQNSGGIPKISTEAIVTFKSNNNTITCERCEEYRVPEFSHQGVDFLTHFSGSSMVPTYNNGDILACKKLPELTFIQWGKAYVLSTSQGLIVKRLFEDKEDKNCVICKSDNEKYYPEFSIPKSKIMSVSIVLGVIRME